MDPDDDADISTENADGNAVWRCPHEPHDDEEECLFHLPEDSDAKPDAETVASAFLEIANGEWEALDRDGPPPAQFIGAEFETLDFDAEKIGDGRPVDLRHAEIGSAEWGVRTVKAEPLDARGLDVRGRWDCDSVTFGGIAGFGEAEFGGIARFEGAEFGESARFGEAEFREDAIFVANGWYPISQFQADADFSDVTAAGPLRFVDTYESPPGRPYTFLGEVDFEGADIPDAEFSGVSFHEAPVFEDTDLTRADLSDLAFCGATFERGNLTRANLSESDLSGAGFNDALLSQASLYGADLTNARLYGSRMDGAHVSDHTDFGVRNQVGIPDRDARKRSSALPFLGPWPNVRYDERNPEYDRSADRQDSEDAEGGQSISDHTRAAAVYAEIEKVAKANAGSQLASRCYRWRKDMQRKRYLSDEGRGNRREPIRWARSWLANIFVRYGESPWRVIDAAGLIIIGCAVLYDSLDLIESTTSPSRSVLRAAVNQAPPDVAVTFLDAVYFSTLTFSTLGMGTFQPSGQVGRAVAIFETLSGVFLLALLVFVFGRRATR